MNVNDPQRWLDLLGCPYCQGALAIEEAGRLSCSTCSIVYPSPGGTPLLARKEDAERLSTFGQDYARAREAEGWRSHRPHEALSLPYSCPEGYHPLYWQVRRESYEALLRELMTWARAQGGTSAADLGAGTGWLSYRLALSGHRVLMVEASEDPVFGLGAAEVYRREGVSLLAVLGNLEHPPLRAASVEILVYNASLHYAGDLDATLRRGAKCLAREGHLVVMDSPVAARPRPATGSGDRHLGRAELERALRAAGLVPRWIPVRRGWRWHLYRAKNALRGGPGFAFPLIVAHRAH